MMFDSADSRPHGEVTPMTRTDHSAVLHRRFVEFPYVRFLIQFPNVKLNKQLNCLEEQDQFDRSYLASS